MTTDPLVIAKEATLRHLVREEVERAMKPVLVKIPLPTAFETSTQAAVKVPTLRSADSAGMAPGREDLEDLRRKEV